MEDRSIVEMTRCCYEYYKGNKYIGGWFSLGLFIVLVIYQLHKPHHCGPRLAIHQAPFVRRHSSADALAPLDWLDASSLDDLRGILQYGQYPFI